MSLIQWFCTVCEYDGILGPFLCLLQGLRGSVTESGLAISILECRAGNTRDHMAELQPSCLDLRFKHDPRRRGRNGCLRCHCYMSCSIALLPVKLVSNEMESYLNPLLTRKHSQKPLDRSTCGHSHCPWFY